MSFRGPSTLKKAHCTVQNSLDEGVHQTHHTVMTHTTRSSQKLHMKFHKHNRTYCSYRLIYNEETGGTQYSDSVLLLLVYWNLEKYQADITINLDINLVCS